MAAVTGGRGWAYGGALLGGAVSVAANVAHSYVPPPAAGPGWGPHGGAVIGAVFWPVALFVGIEILARVPWAADTRWVLLRYAGLLPVAAVAALVSYRHLAGLLAFYGEDPLTASLGPLAVDGLMMMATGALIATSPARTPVSGADSPSDTGTTTDSPPDTVTDPWPDTAAQPDPWPDSDPDTGAEPEPWPDTAPSREFDSAPDPAADGGTAAAVAALRAAHPELSAAAIAGRLGVSDRTVRRHLARTPARPPLHLLATPGGGGGGGDVP